NAAVDVRWRVVPGVLRLAAQERVVVGLAAACEHTEHRPAAMTEVELSHHASALGVEHQGERGSLDQRLRGTVVVVVFDCDRRRRYACGFIGEAFGAHEFRECGLTYVTEVQAAEDAVPVRTVALRPPEGVARLRGLDRIEFAVYEEA